jgi:hypothetical protein
MHLSIRAVVTFFRKWQNLCLFIGGFLFDFITIRRADSWADIALQIVYLAGLAGLMVLQHREHLGRWAPRSERAAKFWQYNVDILHFFYGGLLSNYAVIYFMSSSGARPVIFIFFLAALMIMNEMPQIRRFGHRLRLGLYSFCMSSFMIYFLPIFVGFMNMPIFILSLAVSGGLVWRLAARLADGAADPRAEQRRLFLPAGAVIGLILLLQLLHLIPPVPLSVQAQGIYHGVERRGDGFVLRASKPPWRLFWRRDSRPFRAGEGDRIYYFVRVFAPSRFRAHVMIRWTRGFAATR